MLKPTLDAKQLAEVLHLNTRTITNYVLTHPERLPPLVRLPSGKTLWFEEDVQAWLDERRIKVLPPQRSPTDFSRKWW